MSSWGEVGASIARRPGCFLGRAVRLAAAVSRAWVSLARPLACGVDDPGGDRARRLSLACVRGLRALGVEVQANGPIPDHGLLVANHVSYLDTLVLASLSPATFVAKSDVARWPVFGRLARLSGTVFIRRSRRLAVRPALQQLSRVLDAGGLVVVFPEGTSSDGEDVLPFHPALLTSVRAGDRVHVAWVSYRVPGDDAGRLVAYWGRMLFGAHLLRLLCVRGIRAEVRFARCDSLPEDRKARADHLRQAILDLSRAGSVQARNTRTSRKEDRGRGWSGPVRLCDEPLSP
ncbi:MAG: 1-acyl-sn-glycerol-3-phosphate acyltransferase [Verrucomicrobiae bacterium]|nr:1-acyl-sn-glycerol-3-phosphate acyltransferase [Verrucomicrobiae bacterium]